MLNFKITSNINQILVSLPTKLQIKNSVMEEIGQNVQDRIQYKIANAASFFKSNKKGTRLLYKSGTLYSSIQKSTNLGNVSVFTDLFYSKYLNYGTDKIEARPFFLSESGNVPSDILDAVSKTLENKTFSELFEGFRSE